MGKAFTDIDDLNKLDIISISSVRIKAGIYENIAINNRRLYKLLRILALMNILKVVWKTSVPEIKIVELALKKGIKFFSQTNKFIFNTKERKLIYYVSRMIYGNKYLLSTDKNFYKFYLKRLDKLNIVKRIPGLLIDDVKDVSIYVENKFFNKNQLYKFYALKRVGSNYLQIMTRAMFSKQFKLIENNNRYCVLTKLYGGDMLQGNFKSKLLLKKLEL